MSYIIRLFWLSVIGFGLIACSDEYITTPQVTLTQPLETPTSQQIAIEPSLPPQDTTGASVEPIPAEPAIFPFSERGQYWTGRKEFTLVDASREGREISLTVWYPALKETDAEGKLISLDAAPDMSQAPYPLILTGTATGDYLLKSHLASYGFVAVIIRFPDTYDSVDFQVIDYPLDLLFALDQIGLNSLEGLKNVIDSDNTGVTGFSGDGWLSMAVSGVRLNPEFYLSFCEQIPELEPALAEWYGKYFCGLAMKWDSFAAYVGPEYTDTEDGLWRPVTDERIIAVLPMAVDGAWLYGERGLASANRPALMIAPTEDQYTPYEFETVFIYENLGAPEKALISFIGKNHDMPFESEAADRMKHFAVAFFGYHLQGREDYAYYFSDDFVAQFDDLAWGVYPGE